MISPKNRLPVVDEAASAATRAKAPRWDWKKWGTLVDPIHKSHMSTLLGEFSCTRQFAYDRAREAEGLDERESCSGKTELGTAAHETIARALRNPPVRDSLLQGVPSITEADVRRRVLTEFEHCTAGLEVRWYGKAEQESELNAAVKMVWGLLNDLRGRVAAVELAEAGFIVKLGDFWLEGHVDLVYRPYGYGPDALAFADWKTGAQKPHQLTLDHGFESGFYAHACAHGLFLPLTVLDAWREAVAKDGADDAAAVPLPQDDRRALAAAKSERTAMHVALRAIARMSVEGNALPEGVRTFDRFPEVIRLVHLRDYVPYEKAGKKKVTRPEDLEHWSKVLDREVKKDEQVSYVKGQQRGGAWLDVRRKPEDVTRLERMLRAVAGWVRFGRFVESVSEKCDRCSYRGPCLTSGYEVTGDDAKCMREALRGIDFGATAQLSIDDD